MVGMVGLCVCFFKRYLNIVVSCCFLSFFHVLFAFLMLLSSLVTN